MAKEKKITARELKKWRTVKAKNLTEAAEYFGYSRSYWSRMEHGHDEIPRTLAVAIRCELGL